MVEQSSWFRTFFRAGTCLAALFLATSCTVKTYPTPSRECSTSTECPESTSACAPSRCIAGRCVEFPTNAGMVVEEGLMGDCHRSECDGSGNVVSVIDDLDKPADSECTIGTCTAGTIGFQARPVGFVVTIEPAGDCQRIECDGVGKTMSAADETDLPDASGICFAPTCVAGKPGQTPIPAGTVVEDPLPGDCQRVECDGAGNENSVADASDVPNDNNVCTKDSCIAGVPTYAPIAAGTMVDNGTPGDCTSAQCDGMGNTIMAPNNSDAPSDDAVCTIDACNAGMPVHTPKPTGTSCGGNGAVCHPDGRCDACADPGANCPDNGFGESNDSQNTASHLGTISDADNAGQSFCAVLSGTNDVDWFTYVGNDDLFSEVDPFQSISNGTKGRLCAFYGCKSGATNVTCLGNSTPSTAPDGQSGCCATSPFSVTLECGSVNDHAQVWLRIDNPDADACIPYQVAFHY